MEAKKIPMSEIPKEVMNILRDTALDLEQSLEMTVVEPLRKRATTDLSKIKFCLSSKEWRIFEVSDLADYYSRVRESVKLYPNHPSYKTIVGESETVLNYLDSQFDILYQDGLMMMVSEPIEELIKRTGKKE